MKTIKKHILKCRKFFLLVSAICGMGLACLAYTYCTCIPAEEERLKASLVMLVLALPTAFLLWFFRNHDRQEQIKEAKESNQFNNFSDAVKLFVEKDNIEANSIGLKLLMKLRHQGLYEENINLITPYKNLWRANLQDAKLGDADLQGAKLGDANLEGASLQGANLQGANLWRANLQYADLQDTNLQDADLQGANLQDAELQYANLQGAKLGDADLQGANLEGATYNTKTIFPDGFNPNKHGMKKDEKISF